MNILVTGSAGFIGANLVKRLFNDMKSGTIVGIDSPDINSMTVLHAKGKLGRK